LRRAELVRPFVSIVIPVRNDARRLKTCLAAIHANDYPCGRYEVIVFDNGSTDDSVRIARDASCHVHVATGLRVSELRNRAVQQAQGDIVAFIDADHEIAPGWLTAAADALQQKNVGAAGAPYDVPIAATWVQRTLSADRQPAARGDVEWLPSGNIAVWRSAFMQADGFDSSLETCEDVDFCRRMRAAGYRIVAEPGMHTRHFGEPATLRELFRAELWRGRDNLRVSVRRPLSARTLASAAVSVLQLAAPAFACLAVAAPHQGATPAIAAALLFPFVLSTARAARIAFRSGAGRPAPMDAWLVAVTYDTARALALVSRTAHRRAGRS
jgi:GT2 family glycosyltransferase